MGGAEVLLQHDVGASAGQHAGWGIRVSQLPDPIGMDTRGIHDHGGTPALLSAISGFTDRSN